jgi:hypothetical protein
LATNFPSSQDSFTNPTTSDTLASVSHSQQHSDVNDAVEAIETALLDGAPLHIDDANERVGVGTASPAGTLDVNGKIHLAGGTDRYIEHRSGNNDILYHSDAGDFYRQDIANSSHQFFTGNTERLTIDSSGNVSKPYQPAFYAYLSGSNPTYGTGWTNLIHNATLFNVGGGYSTSTKRFTAPVAGRYLFIMTFSFYNYTRDTRLIVHMDKNGAGYSRIMDWSPNSATTTDETQTASVIMDLAVGNYVYPSINSADSSWSMSAGSLYNSFQGYILG